jgi:hypothetical protein
MRGDWNLTNSIENTVHPHFSPFATVPNWELSSHNVGCLQ